ncbi:GH16239 [Drosophila grimshawi]|uniref:Fucosyltransferase n=1 Tax=Drosophila grimshawi TaxID=7222 RepID=B4IXI4_DROGR|nr:GH16239 [Drosophila grimshawi]
MRRGAKESTGKAILLWSEGAMTIPNCGCLVTSKRNYAGATFEANVFNGDRPYSLKRLDRIRRTPNFLAVYALRHPKSLSRDPLLGHGKTIFNFTMTYRRDSDVIWTDYYFAEEHSKEASFLEEVNQSVANLRSQLQSKSALVFYMIYEVNNNSLPESLYLQELRKYLELDAQISCHGYHDCAQYKFMLIFETSTCPDYVHPQLYTAVVNFVVPVVIGGGNLSQLVPPGSYISGGDVGTPKQLAEHLVELSSQPQLYEQFFWWHSMYRLHKSPHPLCALCRQLGREVPRRERQPGEFLKWWTGYQCPNRTDRLASQQSSA